jgi:hypothetical protein
MFFIVDLCDRSHKALLDACLKRKCEKIRRFFVRCCSYNIRIILTENRLVITEVLYGQHSLFIGEL